MFFLSAALHMPLVVADFQFFELRSFDRAQVTWRGPFGFGFITLITACTYYILRYLVISRHDVTRSSIAVNASFLITVIVEAALVGQSLSWWVLVGSVILFAGIALSRPRPPKGVGVSDGSTFLRTANATSEEAGTRRSPPRS